MFFCAHPVQCKSSLHSNIHVHTEPFISHTLLSLPPPLQYMYVALTPICPHSNMPSLQYALTPTCPHSNMPYSNMPSLQYAFTPICPHSNHIPSWTASGILPHSWRESRHTPCGLRQRWASPQRACGRPLPQPPHCPLSPLEESLQG